MRPTRPIRIVITGHPVAKARAHPQPLMKKGKPVLKNGRPVVVSFTPTHTRKWEADAKEQARKVMGDRPPLRVPVRVTVLAYFAVPTSWPGWKRAAALQHRLLPTGRPDGDNVLKTAKDAIRGVVYTDDTVVVASMVVKAYSDRPRVEITIRPITAGGAQTTSLRDFERIFAPS